MTVQNADPKLNDSKVINQAKILTPEETPVRLQDVMEISREMGIKMSQEMFDVFMKVILSKEFNLSCNDALSVGSTMAAYFLSIWVFLMDKTIASKDDAGITVEYIINGIFKATQKIISSAQEV